MSVDMYTTSSEHSSTKKTHTSSKSKHSMRKSKKKSKMTIEEQIQFDRVKELKCDWNKEETYEFCKKYNFDDIEISDAITKMFECKYTNHTPRSYVIQSTFNTI